LLLDGLNTVEKSHLNELLSQVYMWLAENYRLIDNGKQSEYYDNKLLNIAKAEEDNKLVLTALSILVVPFDQQKQWDKMNSLAAMALPLARAL
jgi:hypothetical protein